MNRQPPRSPPFPNTTLSLSLPAPVARAVDDPETRHLPRLQRPEGVVDLVERAGPDHGVEAELALAVKADQQREVHGWADRTVPAAPYVDLLEGHVQRVEGHPRLGRGHADQDRLPTPPDEPYGKLYSGGVPDRL